MIFNFESNNQPNVLKITKEHEKFIRENNTTLTPKEIADELGLTYQHVYSFMKRNNIYKLKGHVAKKQVVEKKDNSKFFDIDNYWENVWAI